MCGHRLGNDKANDLARMTTIFHIREEFALIGEPLLTRRSETNRMSNKNLTVKC